MLLTIDCLPCATWSFVDSYHETVIEKSTNEMQICGRKERFPKPCTNCNNAMGRHYISVHTQRLIPGRSALQDKKTQLKFIRWPCGNTTKLFDAMSLTADNQLVTDTHDLVSSRE